MAMDPFPHYMNLYPLKSWVAHVFQIEGRRGDIDPNYPEWVPFVQESNQERITPPLRLQSHPQMYSLPNSSSRTTTNVTFLIFGLFPMKIQFGGSSSIVVVHSKNERTSYPSFSIFPVHTVTAMPDLRFSKRSTAILFSSQYGIYRIIVLAFSYLDIFILIVLLHFLKMQFVPSFEISRTSTTMYLTRRISWILLKRIKARKWQIKQFTACSKPA